MHEEALQEEARSTIRSFTYLSVLSQSFGHTRPCSRPEMRDGPLTADPDLPLLRATMFGVDT